MEGGWREGGEGRVVEGGWWREGGGRMEEEMDGAEMNRKMRRKEQ